MTHPYDLVVLPSSLSTPNSNPLHFNLLALDLADMFWNFLALNVSQKRFRSSLKLKSIVKMLEWLLEGYIVRRALFIIRDARSLRYCSHLKVEN